MPITATGGREGPSCRFFLGGSSAASLIRAGAAGGSPSLTSCVGGRDGPSARFVEATEGGGGIVETLDSY